MKPFCSWAWRRSSTMPSVSRPGTGCPCATSEGPAIIHSQLDRFHHRCIQPKQTRRGFSSSRVPKRQVFVAWAEEKPLFAFARQETAFVKSFYWPFVYWTVIGSARAKVVPIEYLCCISSAPANASKK